MTLAGTSATWSVWGNRQGVNVSDVANSRDQARRRAEVVLRAIAEALP